ncbi:MAG: hypothetical protein ACJASJ_001533, partial [Candidatus Azotimanducaceae bacterium]
MLQVDCAFASVDDRGARGRDDAQKCAGQGSLFRRQQAQV